MAQFQPVPQITKRAKGMGGGVKLQDRCEVIPVLPLGPHHTLPMYISCTWVASSRTDAGLGGTAPAESPASSGGEGGGPKGSGAVWTSHQPEQVEDWHVMSCDDDDSPRLAAKGW